MLTWTSGVYVSRPPGQSIKTRVEASRREPVNSLDAVRLDNPLKQGLKRDLAEHPRPGDLSAWTIH